MAGWRPGPAAPPSQVWRSQLRPASGTSTRQSMARWREMLASCNRSAGLSRAPSAPSTGRGGAAMTVSRPESSHFAWRRTAFSYMRQGWRGAERPRAANFSGRPLWPPPQNLTGTGQMPNPFEFIQQVRSEGSKVVWPTRRETLDHDRPRAAARRVRRRVLHGGGRGPAAAGRLRDRRRPRRLSLRPNPFGTQHP